MSGKTVETAEQAVQRVLAASAANEAALQERLQVLRDEAAKNNAAKAKEREAAEAAKAERLQQEAARRFDAEHLDATRRAWLASGGTPEGFEAAWPVLRRELQLESTRQMQQAAKQAAAALYRDF